MRIGIMSAMTEEIKKLVAEMKDPEKIVERGNRVYYYGTLWEIPVTLVFSRWGKVAAATTATHLIIEFKVDEILFSGVAGGIKKGLNIGDIVIGTKLYQHDMNAQPMFAQFEIPLLGKTSFDTNDNSRNKLFDAAKKFLDQKLHKAISAKILKEFNITNPKVVEAEIASGDRFFANSNDKENLIKKLSNIACVEMEGAAVAQVCYEYGIPFSIIRIISDSADESAKINFENFINHIASEYSHGIIEELFRMKKFSAS